MSRTSQAIGAAMIVGLVAAGAGKAQAADRYSRDRNAHHDGYLKQHSAHAGAGIIEINGSRHEIGAYGSVQGALLSAFRHAGYQARIYRGAVRVYVGRSHPKVHWYDGAYGLRTEKHGRFLMVYPYQIERSHHPGGSHGASKRARGYEAPYHGPLPHAGSTGHKPGHSGASIKIRIGSSPYSYRHGRTHVSKRSVWTYRKPARSRQLRYRSSYCR